MQVDTTFETHYSLADLAKQWSLSRETVRLLVKDEPGICRIQLGKKKIMCRYSVPESVACRIHTRLFYPASSLKALKGRLSRMPRRRGLATEHPHFWTTSYQS